MQARRTTEYIIFGTELRYLQDARPNVPYHGKEYIKDNIERFFKKLSKFNLNVTLRAAYRLEDFYEKLSDVDENHNLTVEEASELSKIMNDLRLTLVAEADGNIAFIVTDKRLDIRKLLGDVASLFAPNVFDSCPDIARYDFEEAGKCISFERPTAAAFHILRGTEAVLKIYYKRFIRPAQPNLAWGQMTSALRAKTRGKKPKLITLNNLDHLRVSFRNPTQHPEKVYEIQEVQDLFGLCVDSVNRMIKEL